MANSGPLLTKTVVEKHTKDAREAKAADPYSQRLTRGYQTQGQSHQVRLLAAYQTLRSALVSSTVTSPETFRQAQQAVRNDQRTRNPDKKITSISAKQIDSRIAQLQQTVTQQNAQQAASETVYNAKKSSHGKTGEQPPKELSTPPEIAQQTISLEIEDDPESIVKSSETQAEQNAADTELEAPPSENKPLLPPIAPTKPEPIRVNYSTEDSKQDFPIPSPINAQEHPQGPSRLRSQIEMIRNIRQISTSQMPGGVWNRFYQFATGTPDIITGVSGGSIGPGAILPSGSMAESGAPAAGMPGQAAAQGAKGLASQLPKLASALKLAAAGISLSTIGWIVLAIVIILIILLLISSGSGGNVANLVPTNEFLPLGTGGGSLNTNPLYGDGVRVVVQNPCWPTSGTITQLPNTNHSTTCGNKGVGVAYHQAIDIAGALDTPIYTPYAGTICRMATQRDEFGLIAGYGLYMAVCTKDFDMVFAHLFRYEPGITVGMPVAKGQKIAYMGNSGNSSGNHLHFEITGITTCRPYNLLDILPETPALQVDVTYVNQSCSQYLGTGGENVPL